MSKKLKVGFIGVGNMGHGMAANILKGGYQLVIKGNRNREPINDLVARGATEASSIGELAAQCDVIHLCLGNSVQVEATLRGPEGIIAHAKPGTIVIDTTTSDPNSTHALSQELLAANMSMVDAPLGRTPKEAEEGTLDAMVGGSTEDVAKVHDIIDCWAGTITHIGEVGAAHKMKLVMNFISLGYGALFSEALSLGTKVGLSPQTIDNVIGSSRMSNGFFETFMRAAVGREREAHKFSIENAAKDIGYAKSMGEQAGVSNPLATATHAYFTQARDKGHAQEYVPALADIVAMANGIDLEKEVQKGA